MELQSVITVFPRFWVPECLWQKLTDPASASLLQGISSWQKWQRVHAQEGGFLAAMHLQYHGCEHA